MRANNFFKSICGIVIVAHVISVSPVQLYAAEQKDQNQSSAPASPEALKVDVSKTVAYMDAYVKAFAADNSDKVSLEVLEGLIESSVKIFQATSTVEILGSNSTKFEFRSMNKPDSFFSIQTNYNPENMTHAYSINGSSDVLAQLEMSTLDTSIVDDWVFWPMITAYLTVFCLYYSMYLLFYKCTCPVPFYGRLRGADCPGNLERRTPQCRAAQCTWVDDEWVLHTDNCR